MIEIVQYTYFFLDETLYFFGGFFLGRGEI